MRRLFVLAASLLLFACSPKADPKAAAEPLKTIRIGAIGAPGSKTATGFMGVLQSQQRLEQAFAKDGVKIQWVVLDGAGPAQNEAIANGLVDFGNYGALPNIVGRARGLKTKVLASYGYSNVYIVARPDAGIAAPKDLKGKTVAVDIGHVPHLSLVRILTENGVDPAQVQLVNMNSPDGVAAVAAGKVDATLGSSALLSLVDQGKGRLIFDSRKAQSEGEYFGAFVVTEDFARRYPEASKRVLEEYLKAVAWASDPANREAYLDLVARNGATPRNILEQDLAGQSVRDKASPLIDDYYVQRFRDAVAFSVQQKLIRKSVDLDGWFARDIQAAALKDLGLEAAWTPRDANGQAVAPVRQAEAVTRRAG